VDGERPISLWGGLISWSHAKTFDS